MGRIFMEAEPIENDLVLEMEEDKVNPKAKDSKEQIAYLAKEYSWNPDHAKKIWCFGPDVTGPNVVCDAAKGVDYLNEIKDSVVSGFQWASNEVPVKLCQPPEESCTLLSCEPKPDFKSQSLRSKFSVHRLLPVVFTVLSHQSEVLF